MDDAWPMEDFVYTPPPVGPLTTLFENDAIVVCDKPAGLLSVPGRLPAHKDSLYTRLLPLYPELMVVHRLDLATSGLIVFAKNLEANRALSRQFQQRSVKKRYIAIVTGVPDEASGEIDLPLICDWPNRPRQIVDHQQGKPSTTLWVRGKERQVGGLRACEIELTPITGRSHQLRVHMAELGHAIIGDGFYADEAARSASPRLLLHAQWIAFEDPVSGAPLEFTAPCPF